MENTTVSFYNKIISSKVSNEISLTDAMDVIRSAMKIKRIKKDKIFLWGLPGIGKSAAIAQLVEEENERLLKITPKDELFANRDGKYVAFDFVDIRLSLKDATDISGLPTFYTDTTGKKRTEWALPDEFPTNPNWKGIIFLDEFNLAQPLVMNACYQLVEDRRIGTYKLPDGAIIIAAGNGDNCKAFNTELPDAMKDRFTHINIAVDFNAWSVWAIKNNINQNIITFLKTQRPELFYDKQTMGNGENVFATPRSWEVVSQILELEGEVQENTLKNHINGRIGVEAGTIFWNYLQKSKKLPSFEDILNNKVKMPEDELDVFYSCVIGCLYTIKNIKDKEQRGEQIHNFIEVIDKLNKVENGTLALKLTCSVFNGEVKHNWLDNCIKKYLEL